MPALFTTHKNIAELWNVMTRPVSRNGFGLTAAEAEHEVETIESGMTLLTEESEAAYDEWRRIVVQHAVSGVQVHDARLVATMRVHGVTHLLTLNVSDFARYGGITAVHPSVVHQL
jgi:predicted nucleic acid-binding protein